MARQRDDVRRVLITGVRGKTGAPLAEVLRARGDIEVLGGARDPAAVPDPAVPFDWADPAGFAEAVRGVDAVFVVRPDIPDAPERIAELAAHTAPGTHLTLLSEFAAGDFAFDSWARRTERAVTGSGRPWTLLRPSWFMQVFTDERYFLGAVRAGSVPMPAGSAPVSWIDTRDIADVAAHTLTGDTLTGDTHAGRAYELTGPEAHTLAETAQLLGAATGRSVVHDDVAVSRAAEGLTGFDRDALIQVYENVSAGWFSPVTTDVHTVTGHPARTLADFAAEHRATLLGEHGGGEQRQPKKTSASR